MWGLSRNFDALSVVNYVIKLSRCGDHKCVLQNIIGHNIEVFFFFDLLEAVMTNGSA